MTLVLASFTVPMTVVREQIPRLRFYFQSNFPCKHMGIEPTKSSMYGVSDSRDRSFRVPFSTSRGNSPEDVDQETKFLQVLESWDVPWDWLTVLYVMLPYLMSIFLTGFVESAGLQGGVQLYSQKLNVSPENADELAIKLFLDQFLKTAVKLSIIYAFVRQYEPIPHDVFSFGWTKPFDLRRGWVIWGGSGLLVAMGTVFLTRAAYGGSSAGQEQNEYAIKAFAKSSPWGNQTSPVILCVTACVVAMVGVLAPISEEILYRGFFMVSLTKWLPVPVSVLLSSSTFACAHQSGKFLEIFIFGVVLGLVYAQTRSLFTVFTMHACWNVGVILLLTFLQGSWYLYGFNMAHFPLVGISISYPSDFQLTGLSNLVCP